MIDAPNAERAQLSEILAEGRAGRPRLLQKMLGAEDPPAEAEIKKAAPCKRSAPPPQLELTKLREALGTSFAPDRRLSTYSA